jgi:hypothetical protein
MRRSYDESDRDEEAPVVLGSGNLGLLYLREPTRSTLDQLDERWPRLVPTLAAHPGVGFVAGIDAAGRPWAIGGGGRHNLDTGELEGDDPLAVFGEHAPRVLRRAVLMPEAPDLYVNSSVDPVTLDVAAFEGLVGAHGGLGGWQDHGVLLVPTELEGCFPDRVEGADVLHQALLRVLRSCGHRTGIDDPAEAPPLVTAPGAASRR